eukprot:2450723-Amphidinium_carterae.1
MWTLKKHSCFLILCAAAQQCLKRKGCCCCCEAYSEGAVDGGGCNSGVTVDWIGGCNGTVRKLRTVVVAATVKTLRTVPWWAGGIANSLLQVGVLQASVAESLSYDHCRHRSQTRPRR